MTKYKEYIDLMIKENKELFDDFKNLHAQYGLDPDKYQEEFNKKGGKILEIANIWEGKLCSQSEKAGFSNYTGNLAEKFRGELKNIFPLIDHIGIIVKNSEPFSIKKINL